MGALTLCVITLALLIIGIELLIIGALVLRSDGDRSMSASAAFPLGGGVAETWEVARACQHEAQSYGGCWAQIDMERITKITEGCNGHELDDLINKYVRRPVLREGSLARASFNGPAARCD